jgi:hypothetical protein
MARLQRDLIRLQTNHLGQNAIAMMKRAFTSTILSVRVDKNTRLVPKMLSRVKCPRCLRSIEKYRRYGDNQGQLQQYIIRKVLTRCKNKKLVLDNVAFHKSKIVKVLAEDRDIDLCLHLPIVHGSIRSSLHSL